MPVAGGLHYFASKEQSPSSLPLVLVHGAGGCHAHWPHHLRRLAGYRVYAPDLPGHGRSDGLGEQAAAAYARRLADWLLEIGLTRAVWVGHSLGGAIVQSLALNHPEAVLGLGVFSSGARLTVNPDLLNLLSAPATQPSAVEQIVKWSYTQHVPARLTTLLKEQLLENRPAVLLGDFRAADSFNSTESLAQISVPTLVLCGADDRMTPPRLSELLAEGIPGAELAIISAAGHMVMQEQPAATAAALAAFLPRIRW